MKPKISKVSALHFFRLIFRSALFLTGLISYIVESVHQKKDFIGKVLLSEKFIIAIWIIFVVEMILRFFPSKLESPGCQKQFARNYIKTGSTDVQFDDNNATALVALLWCTLNGIIGGLKMAGFLTDEIMLLICLLYSICDMICILFFCPFQSWFFKNKCCVSCRIYNWDYAMMFTPLFFVRKWYTWSLLLLSVGLMFRWELTIFLHPERFSAKTNAYMNCSNCTEKLCSHKKQLHGLWTKIADFTKARAERLLK